MQTDLLWLRDLHTSEVKGASEGISGGFDEVISGDKAPSRSLRRRLVSALNLSNERQLGAFKTDQNTKWSMQIYAN